MRALQQRPDLAAAPGRTGRVSGPRPRSVRTTRGSPEDGAWSVGVALQLPFVSGFARTHRVERATLEAKILEAEAAFDPQCRTLVSAFTSASEVRRATMVSKVSSKSTLAGERPRDAGHWVLPLVAVAFGLKTIWEGGNVLFGRGTALRAAGNYVPFVLWFNSSGGSRP